MHCAGYSVDNIDMGPYHELIALPKINTLYAAYALKLYDSPETGEVQA
jgi:hypothetical protein